MLEFFAMKLTRQAKLAIVMSLHALWGLVLWFSISKYGLGVSTDSVQLLYGGLNLWEGKGLTSYDGSFVLLWPPLYPALLGFIHRISGLGIFAASNLLQGLAFVGLSYCLAQLFLKIFPGNFGLALAANALADIGVVVLIGFGTVGSDYLGLFLVFLFMLLLGSYIETTSGSTFLALAIVGMLATLNRYLGAALLAAGALSILVLAEGSLRQRLWRGFFLFITGLPAGIWLAITSQFYARRGPITFEENFRWFSKSILEWFLGPVTPKRNLDIQIVCLWTTFLLLIVLVLVLSRRPEVITGRGSGKAAAPGSNLMSFLVPLWIFGLCYVLALFGAASTAYFNKLGGRFLLPLYIPLITLPVAAADVLMRSAGGERSRIHRMGVSVISFGALAGLGLVLLRITLPLVVQSHANGAPGGENVFNTRAWHENAALIYWLSHVPEGEYVLLSNEPDGTAFNTQHPARSTPRKTSGPYGTEVYPLSDYAQELFPPDSEVYLLWIEANAQPYFYSVDELKAVAEVEPLFVSDEGGVYRLRPKTGT